MNSKHTKEPWSYSGDIMEPYPIRSKNGGVNTCDPDNARRIVACVNACAGIPIAQLESDYQQGYEPWGHVKHLETQRDALLSALKNVSKQLYDETGIAFRYVDGLIDAVESGKVPK